MANGKFLLGQVVTTPGALKVLVRTGALEKVGGALIARHLSGDWGDVPAGDWKLNDAALTPGKEDRLMSSYMVGDVKVWIITEWDRSVTTVLLPSEY